MNQHKRVKFVVVALLLASPATSASAQRRPDALRDMVATERAFSRMSEQKGTREAFSAFIADDGILFRPRAVFGKKWMQENPLPPSTTRSLLVWQPVLAGMSRAGDLGYTTGPWRYKNDIKDAKSSAFGNFMTVWKKQADGKWRFLVDLGISNSEPKSTAKLLLVPPTRENFGRVDVAKARADLMTAEQEFSKASAQRGAVEAFLFYAANDVRVFREQKQPFIGKKSSVAAMTPLLIAWTWTPAFADVSSSGDLGYSYGLYELRDKTTNTVTESGNYLRVWRRIGSGWRVILDLTNPLPAEKKS